MTGRDDDDPYFDGYAHGYVDAVTADHEPLPASVGAVIDDHHASGYWGGYRDGWETALRDHESHSAHLLAPLSRPAKENPR